MINSRKIKVRTRRIRRSKTFNSSVLDSRNQKLCEEFGITEPITADELINFKGEKLKYSRGPNAKIDCDSISLLSGHSCPFAKDCLSKVDLVRWATDGKRRIVDGDVMRHRCFSASAEATYPETFLQRKHNLETLRACKTSREMLILLILSIPDRPGHPLPGDEFRIHVGGDFFNRMYFLAWCAMATLHPHRTFYAYTKSLIFWAPIRKKIPENLSLTASRGGTHDHLIEQHNLKEAIVVFSESQADALGLEIDHDDSHALRNDNSSFALLIHGQQAKNSEASRAIKKLKEDGVKYSYSR